jgi:hypothetical protein
MGHTRDETTQHRAERLWWAVASRDDARVARRLDRTPVLESVYRLDAGAVRDDCCPCLQALGVRALCEHACGAGLRRAMGPVVQDVLR